MNNKHTSTASYSDPLGAPGQPVLQLLWLTRPLTMGEREHRLNQVQGHFMNIWLFQPHTVNISSRFIMICLSGLQNKAQMMWHCTFPKHMVETTQGNIMMSSFEKHWYKISYCGFVCEMCRVYLLAMKNSKPIKLFSASLIHFISC